MGNTVYNSMSDGNEAPPPSRPIKAVKMTPQEAETVVYKKLSSSVVLRNQAKGDEEKMRDLAKQLSTPEALKTTYLATTWLESCNLYKQYDVEEVVEEKKSKRDRAKSVFTSRNSAVSASLIDREEFGNGADNSSASVGTAELESLAKQKIKLLISETMTTKHQRALRMLASPFLSSFKVFPDVGIFHVALLIGPWKIEWNDSSLCIPRKIVSGAAVMSTDIDSIHTIDKLEDVTEKLARVIVKWNTQMKYKEGATDNKSHGNCQDFIDDVMKELGLERICEVMAKGELPVARFFRKLRQTGSCTLEFPMDQVFRSKFDIEEENKIFKTHVELDEFVIKLKQVDPNFAQTYPLEWALLKSFDRAFWLKHYRYRFRDEHIPLVITTVTEEDDVEQPPDSDDENSHNSDEHSHDEHDGHKENGEEKPPVQKKKVYHDKMSCPFGDPATSSFIGGR